VLHPIAECSGAPCVVTHTDGSISQGHFPDSISPHQPFLSVQSLRHPLDSGLEVEVVCTGDVFEMEDQRNWTDASFKTYCTPAALGYPFLAQPGQRQEQTVTIRLESEAEQPPGPEQVRVLRLGTGTGRSLPSIGLSVASDEAPPTEHETDLLTELALDHLRIDIRLSRKDWRARLHEALRQAQDLGTRLEVALFVPSTDGRGDIDDATRLALVRAVGQRLERQPVVRWLVFDEATSGTGTTPPGLGTLVREALSATHPDPFIAGGTDGDFAELNRDRPDLAALDALVYSVNPQVHASDDRSLTETVTTHGTTVATARSFADGRQIVVSPVTLAPRFNPVATGPEATMSEGELPRSVDHRQPSLLAAAWTVGSMANLAAAGAVSTTWFETVGWRGLIERPSGSRAPGRFLSKPGMVFPVFHVIAYLGQMQSGELLSVASPAPRAVAGLATRHVDRVTGIVANLTPDHLPVAVEPLASRVRIRTLDETTAVQAMTDVAAFRQSGHVVSTVGGSLELKLRPYSVVTFESDLRTLRPA
jgi:hypothetical protein